MSVGYTTLSAAFRLAMYHNMLAIAIAQGRADSAYYLTQAMCRAVTDL